MPTPVAQRPMPQNSGGNNPVQQAATMNLRGGAAPAAASPMQAPAGPAGQGAALPQGGGNELAGILAAAFEALLRTGPTPQNLSALEGFWRSVMELSSAGNQPQAPLGQAPGSTPLPPPPQTAGMAPAAGPMVPPRQV